MALDFDIGRILSQYGNDTAGRQSPDIEQDFDRVAQNTSQDDLADGLHEAFRSDQTPPFPDMMGQLFGQANGQQRTGMMNQLMGALGPAIIGSMMSRGLGGGQSSGMGSGGGLGSLLGSMLGQQQPQLRQEDVDRMTPEDFREVAQHAERENPGIMEHMSRFYSQNPELVKGLGGAALAIALGKMAQRNR